MTIDKAIDNCKKTAEFCDEKASEMSKLYLDCGIKSYHWEAVGYYICSSKNKQFVEWLEDYKRLKENDGWIYVDDQLPKENKQYLILYSEFGWNGKKYRNMELAFFDHGVWVVCGDNRNNFEIIAWHPLPEMPEDLGGVTNEQDGL